MQVEWLCSELASDPGGLVWPTVHYGYYPAFHEFPGSPSLDHDCFESTLRAVIDGMRRSGHRSLLVVNSGISTIPSVDAACAGACTAWHIYSASRYRAAVAEIEEQAHGGHADELETSLMLYIAGERVLPGLAVAEDRPFQPGPLNRNRPDAVNYTASGAMGDPTLASRAKGERLAHAMLEDGRAALHRGL